MNCQIQYDPSFVEEGVFVAIQSLEVSGSERELVERFHFDKNAIYEKNRREEAFQQFFKKYFECLGLKAVFKEMVSQFYLLDDPSILVFIKRVFSKRQESSELYVERNSKTVLLGLQASRLGQQEFLKVFLRHELLRISDMLDPAFGYSPDVDPGGGSEMENNRIRERFSRLWDLAIVERLFGKKESSKEWTQKGLLELARHE